MVSILVMDLNVVMFTNLMNYITYLLTSLKQTFVKIKIKWKHKILRIEISKNESDRVVDLLIYKNHYALIKKLNVFLGDHHKIFICRRCWKSYTSENMLMLYKPNCENNDITTIRTSLESHLP